MVASVHFTGTVNVTPVLRRTRNDRVWVQLLVLVPTVSRESKGNLVEESTLIPVSCFRNAAEQAKNLKAADKITVIARLRGSKFIAADGIERNGIQLLAERIFVHRESRPATGVNVVLDITAGSSEPRPDGPAVGPLTQNQRGTEAERDFDSNRTLNPNSTR